jgi:hypothetical protein
MLAEKTALLSSQDIDETSSSIDSRATPGTPTSERDQSTIPLVTPNSNPTADPLAYANGRDNIGTPPIDAPQTPTKPMSEKARGKMRATESTTSLPNSNSNNGEPEIPDEELLKVAHAGVGPNGYIPTQEWVSSWQKG